LELGTGPGPGGGEIAGELRRGRGDVGNGDSLCVLILEPGASYAICEGALEVVGDCGGIGVFAGECAGPAGGGE